MALLGSLTTDDGVLHSTAVAICAETNIHFINKHAKVIMNVYHSAAAFSGGKTPVKQYSYSFDEAALEEVLDAEDNVIVQGIPAFDEVFDLNALEEGETILTKVTDFILSRIEFTGWSEV